MATNIPPHNLGEIADACVYMLEKWEKLDDINVEDLMEFVEGPDFPTGGIIIEQKGEEGIEAAYGKGRGRVTIQANAHIEEMERGKSRIIVTELPYQVNKSSLIERIAELVRDGQLEGITDLRDEFRPAGLAHRYRTDQERRTGESPFSTLQAHTHAVHFQYQLAGSGGQRAAPA